MIPVVPMQTAGSGLAVVVTFLVAALFYAVTLYLAATFYLGETRKRSAVAVGLAVAAPALLLARWGPSVVAPMMLGVDAVAILLVYDRSYRETAVLTVLHFTFSVLLFFPLRNVFQAL